MMFFTELTHLQSGFLYTVDLYDRGNVKRKKNPSVFYKTGLTEVFFFIKKETYA